MVESTDAAAAPIINLSVNGTQLDLVENESFSFDGGEDFGEFEPGSTSTNMRIPGRKAPEASFESTVERASHEGLEALGFVEAGSYAYGESRFVDEVTAEFLDGDNGSVVTTITMNDCVAEFDSLDHESPLAFSATLHINGNVDIEAEVAE